MPLRFSLDTRAVQLLIYEVSASLRNPHLMHCRPSSLIAANRDNVVSTKVQLAEHPSRPLVQRNTGGPFYKELGVVLVP